MRELDAPGAGLPWPESQIVKLRIWWALRRKSQDSFAALLAIEKKRILDLVSGCRPGELQERVLISRVRGMEDSSRDWSVLMTLDHLRIVNVLFTGLIRNLERGNVPQQDVRTADVKPDPEVGYEVVEEFENGCDLLLRCWEPTKDAPKLAFSHPWFGKLNANEWRALGAIHLRLHRIQVERIIAGLP